MHCKLHVLVSVFTIMCPLQLTIPDPSCVIDSRVYSWGRNNYCQLGHSPDQSTVPSLKVVPGLESVPIHSITAGGAHNFVVSECGLAYGWGRNRYVFIVIANCHAFMHSLRSTYIMSLALLNRQSVLITLV